MRKDTPPATKPSKTSNGLHHAVKKLFEAFMCSPCFIQFKDTWIAEKLLFTYGIYDTHVFHQTLGIHEGTSAGKASIQFTNREA